MQPSGIVRRAADLAPPLLLAGMGLAQVAGVPAGDEFAGAWWLDAAFVVICAAPLWWRRRAPGPVLLAVVLANLVWTEVVFAPTDEVVLETWFMLLVAVWSVTVHGSRRDVPWAVAAFVIELGLAVLESARGVPSAEQAVPIVSFVVTIGAGWALRRQQHVAGELARRTDELEREREARARESAELERARIARDLHDLVTHAMTAVVLNASAQRERLSPDDPSVPTLRSIEELTRTALSDLRRSLGLLRPPNGAPAEIPSPEWLLALAGTARGAGMRVEVDDQRAGSIDPAVELNIFRITQEAVTNALRHAPGSRVTIAIQQGEGALRLLIENGAPGVDTGTLTRRCPGRPRTDRYPGARACLRWHGAHRAAPGWWLPRRGLDPAA